MCQLSSYCLLAQISPSLPHFVVLELVPVNDSLLPASGMLALSGEGDNVTMRAKRAGILFSSRSGSLLCLFVTGAPGGTPAAFSVSRGSEQGQSPYTLWQWYRSTEQPGPGSASFCCCCFATIRLHVPLMATYL